MSDSTREVCEGLLRAMGHNAPEDMSLEHTRTAARFRACFAHDPSLDAYDLVRKLDMASDPRPEARELRGQLIGLAKYPVKPLAWAWADVGKGPGQLDMASARDSETAVGAITTWLRSDPCSALVLSGGAGCGKTVAAVRLAVSQRGTFIEAAKFDEMDFQERATMDRLVRASLLVIDELGRESPHGKTPGRISEVIRARHDNGMPTVITTQLVRDGSDKDASFAKRYGGHLIDRIENDGRWVELKLMTRRGSGERPRLDGLLRSCRIAHLHDKLMVAGTDIRVVHELRDMLGIDQAAIDAGMAERAEELTMLSKKIARLQDSVHAEIVRRLVGEEVSQ